MVSENTQQFNGGSTNTLELAHSGQELDEEQRRRRHHKKLCMWGLGLVSTVVVAIVIAGVVLGSRGPRSPWAEEQNTDGDISLEDILTSAFYARDFNGTWISGHEIRYRDEDGNIAIHNVKTMKKEILIAVTNPIMVGLSDVYLSADRKFLLIEKNPRKLYRHSYLADYFILNLETGDIDPLKHEGKVVELQLVTWSPIGHSLVYVRNNNIYYLHELEMNGEAIALTQDGIFGVIYHGVPDWVYEEEVFSSNTALWFSPSGKQLAFASFNDTDTHIMPIPYYGRPGDLNFQYPLEQRIRYPKAGSTNPTVKLSVINLDLVIRNKNVIVRTLGVPVALNEKDPIVATLAWATDDDLVAIWMNRNQNHALITSYDTIGTTIFIVASLHETHGWIETFSPPIFSKDGRHFIMVKSHSQSNNAGEFAHVTIYERKVSAAATPLTSGTFTVTEIIAWDEPNSFIYFLANDVEDPAVRHLHRISTSEINYQSQCITCDRIILTSDLGAEKPACLYNGADFSTDKSYFVWSCSGPDVPRVAVYETSTLNPVFVWEENLETQSIVSKKSIPQIRRFKVPVGENYFAQVKLLVPQDIDESGRTKYPMLVKVYAGPGSYQITERFGIEWESYLVSNRSYVVAMIDGRGSGLKGDRMMFSGYRKLGTVEIYDQINVTRHIQDEIPFVDPARTAIWGWSYGGYATGMALALDKKNVFKCGMSVAPVTDWALYDSIYTERYMGQPTKADNLLGYSRALMLDKVEPLREKQYFLIHGTMDDNVHYQQSMMLARVLEREDIMFRQLSYPDEDHGLAGVRRHLYHNLEDFLNHCFDKSIDC